MGGGILIDSGGLPLRETLWRRDDRFGTPGVDAGCCSTDPLIVVLGENESLDFGDKGSVVTGGLYSLTAGDGSGAGSLGV